MDHTIASSSSASAMPETTTVKPGFADGTKEVRSFDGIDDDAELDYHGHLRNTNHDEGFTRTDAREMKRMGKKQELRVRIESFVQFSPAHNIARETSVRFRPLHLRLSFKEPGKSC